jgi:hypothetical protein
MRTSRRLKAWEQAGLICHNAEAITVTGSVTPTVPEDTAAVTEAADVLICRVAVLDPVFTAMK